MIIGVYGDVHITKNMRSLQSMWDVTAMKSICNMYDKFDKSDVEMVVCLGDFFDAPKLEAKNMDLVLPVLSMINNKTYPTYILLGNHEADSTESNILEFLGSYDNIVPVTTLTEIESMVFVPYYESLEDIGQSIHNKIVFTHHDIYGSDLASGKTTAFFGADPTILRSARLVMNGHVHLKSKPADNIVNTGSFLISQQGELRLGEFPSYYILDTTTADYQTYNNEYSMIYLTINENEADKVVLNYDQRHCVLRVEYDEEIPTAWIDTAHTSWKKRLGSIEITEDTASLDRNFDMKNYIVDYIKHDPSIEEKKIEEYVSTGLELLS